MRRVAADNACASWVGIVTLLDTARYRYCCVKWEIVVCCTSQSLPLWGRWQPEGLTEEVQHTRFFYTRYGEMVAADLIRPAFPKGEGIGA